ncbi:hypothetical protein MMC25_000491 [Agyrium rufum]|nr:hypothetical protein [Agyrium rufum]
MSSPRASGEPSSTTSAPPPKDQHTTPGAFPVEDADEAPTISSKQTLNQAVHARRQDFTVTKTVRIKVGTWNVASCSGTEKDVQAWFVDGQGISQSLADLTLQPESELSPDVHADFKNANGVESVTDQEYRRTKKASTVPRNDPGVGPAREEIGIYALGLQEIVDISSVTESLRPYNDPNPARKWKNALQSALPKGYTLVAEQQLLGLLLLVYASPSIAPTISSISTTSVGTGLMGYMGNKGAVTARIVLGDTTRLVFVNCHLAAGAESNSVERRHWDASEVMKRTRFDPIEDGGGVTEEFGECIGEEDFTFWFGDLNYRLEGIPGDDVRRLLMIHTRNEYDTQQSSSKKIDEELHSSSSSFRSKLSTASDDQHSTNGQQDNALDPSLDPSSLQTVIASLLPHDQLLTAMKSRKAFYDGWREGEIKFLPTYKYDVGSVGMFDSSEKKRGPSWCDRILYRTRRDKLDFEQKQRDEQEARKRDEEMKKRGLADSTDEDVLYEYDPATDGANDDYDEMEDQDLEPGAVPTKSGFQDKLRLDSYISHQRVLSSDHKPLDAIFTLDYDAVDSERKTKVYQEVARELDQAENEGRPTIALVQDHHWDSDGSIPTVDSDETMNFGHVRFDDSKTRSATVANIGRVLTRFGFIDRPGPAGESQGTNPAWLSIKFDRPSDNSNGNPNALREYTLMPGETLNIEFKIRISDIEQVRSFNNGRSRIEDILVLRVHNGRDHFIPIRGKWLRSSFGRSLDKLIRIPEGGVRKLQHQRPDDSNSSSSSPSSWSSSLGSHGSQRKSGEHHDGGSSGSAGDEVKWSAPREIFRLTEAIDALVEGAVAEREMRRKDLPATIEDVVDDEELGWPFDAGSWELVSKNDDDDDDGHSEAAALTLSVRESLDNDVPIALLSHASVTSKVEAVCSTFLLFLSSLEDGVIPAETWTFIEQTLTTIEKSAGKSTSPEFEEKRAQILDVLSTAATAPHGVVFTLISFTITRVLDAIAPLPAKPSLLSLPPKSASLSSWINTKENSKTQQQNNKSSVETENATRKRNAVKRRFAEIFADVLIRAPLPHKGKGKRGARERRVAVVESFL